MLTPEAADVVNRGHDKDVAPVKAAPKSIDFMKDDAPFKTNFSIGDHKGDFQFYGVIDETLVNQNHALQYNTALPDPSYSWNTTLSRTNPNVSSRTSFVGQGLQNSRVGIKGGVDLIGSTKLIFNLEEVFDPVTGEITNAAKSLAHCSGTYTSSTPTCGSLAADSSINGGLGNRQAYFGLEDPKLGKLVYGFINSPEKDIIGSFDPVKSDTFSPLGESGKVGGGGISPDARLNNAFKYTNKYDTGNGVVNGVFAYQIGDDIGNTGRGYAWSAGFGYSNKDWWNLDVQAVYGYYEDSYKAGSVANTSTNGIVGGSNVLALTEYNVHTNAFVASVKPLPYLKASAGYTWYMDSAPTDNYGSSGTYNTNAWGYAASISAATSATKYSVAFGGGELDIGELYPALQGLKLQAGFYDYTANKTLSTEYDVYTTSLVLDYKINKRFDTYAAFTNNKWVGPGSSNTDANYFTDIRAYGVGLRMAF